MFAERSFDRTSRLFFAHNIHVQQGHLVNVEKQQGKIEDELNRRLKVNHFQFKLVFLLFQIAKFFHGHFFLFRQILVFRSFVPLI